MNYHVAAEQLLRNTRFFNPLFFHKHSKQIGSYQQYVNNPVNSVFRLFYYFFSVFLFYTFILIQN